MRRIFTRPIFFRNFSVDLISLMKPALAMALITMSSVASAVQMRLVMHQITAESGVISTLLINGEHVSGISPPSTATWSWDGATLTSVGFYGATGSLGGSPFSGTINSDQVTDLVISTGGTPGGTAIATAYVCVEGNFLNAVGANACGGYTFGSDFLDDSTTVWGPGLAVSQTIGGDDVSTDGPRTLNVAFDFGLDNVIGVDGLSVGDQIEVGNGLLQGTPAAAST